MLPQPKNDWSNESTGVRTGNHSRRFGHYHWEEHNVRLFIIFQEILVSSSHGGRILPETILFLTSDAIFSMQFFCE